MKFRTSLRYRIAIAFALLGGVISLVLAVALYWLTVNMEQRLVAETLSTELEDYIQRYNKDPTTRPPANTVMRTWVLDRDNSAGVPAGLHELDAGLHQVQLDGRNFYAEVKVAGEHRFMVLYDAARIRQREQQYRVFLAIAVLIMAALSAALGLWLAGRLVSPVSELARRVRLIRPEGQPLLMGQDFPRDEVGFLAAEFDAYQERLHAFIERERGFTADVSHELRTPLAVIEGAAEVLGEDPQLDEAQRTRVRRIARAAREMTEMTSALLDLAREQRADEVTARCRVDELLQQVVDSHRYLLERREVSVQLDITARPELPVACALLRVVLANLVRNAFSYTEQGSVHITLDAEGMSVADTGAGIPEQQQDRVFEPFYSAQGGEGIGLSLVLRICQNYGWEINLDSRPGEGTRFRLDFNRNPLSLREKAGVRGSD